MLIDQEPEAKAVTAAKMPVPPSPDMSPSDQLHFSPGQMDKHAPTQNTSHTTHKPSGHTKLLDSWKKSVAQRSHSVKEFLRPHSLHSPHHIPHHHHHRTHHSQQLSPHTHHQHKHHYQALDLSHQRHLTTSDGKPFFITHF